jgi:hypothetical protein
LLSSAVSWFDPVPIEIAAGFRLACDCEFAQTIWLSMGKTIGGGARTLLVPLGAFSGDPKIDQFSHFVSRR